MLIAVASVTFTFHNVSINSAAPKQNKNAEKQFTFHNVSINSSTLPETAHLIDLFTFHNVSINSKLHPQNVRKKYDLHSIMYLLIRFPEMGYSKIPSIFTFHNVSINS